MRTHAVRIASAAAPVAAGKPVRAHPAVRAILRPRIQPKLKIGGVDDAVEREADCVADQDAAVMIAASTAVGGTVRRLFTDCEEERQHRTDGRPDTAGGPAPAAETAIRSLGRGAPAAGLRARLLRAALRAGLFTRAPSRQSSGTRGGAEHRCARVHARRRYRLCIGRVCARHPCGPPAARPRAHARGAAGADGWTPE